MKVISISGGRSSAMMLYILKENDMLHDTVVCFANTGKESAETLDFINECSMRWQIPVVWLEYITEKPKFKIVSYETAAREGEPFSALLSSKKYLPNPVKRICTTELKIKTIRRYIRTLGIKGNFDTYLGLRYDEPNRVSRKKAQNASGKDAEVYLMPLYDMKLTIADRDKFWINQPFDLKISSLSDNCDLCFMKGKWNLVNAIRQNPSVVDWWIEKENESAKSAKRKRHGQFREGYSYQDLKLLALNQMVITFPEEITESLTCNCTD